MATWTWRINACSRSHRVAGAVASTVFKLWKSSCWNESGLNCHGALAEARVTVLYFSSSSMFSAFFFISVCTLCYCWAVGQPVQTLRRLLVTVLVSCIVKGLHLPEHSIDSQHHAFFLFSLRWFISCLSGALLCLAVSLLDSILLLLPLLPQPFSFFIIFLSVSLSVSFSSGVALPCREAGDPSLRGLIGTGGQGIWGRWSTLFPNLFLILLFYKHGGHARPRVSGGFTGTCFFFLTTNCFCSSLFLSALSFSAWDLFSLALYIFSCSSYWPRFISQTFG